MRQFKKAPAYAGKPLSLYVHRGNRTIGDNEVLTGDEWVRFVGLGYLVEVPEAKIVELTEPMKPVSRIMHSHVETVVEPPAPPVKVLTVEDDPAKKPASDLEAEATESPTLEQIVSDEKVMNDLPDGAVTKSPFSKPHKKAKR